MTSDLWAQVDAHYADLIGTDDILNQTLHTSAAAGLPDIAVSPHQGRLLQLLVGSIGAKHVLEIGTLGGYSTIWMARALPPDGRIVTLEYEPLHAEVAQGNIARAGFADRVSVRVGAAIETLPKLAAEGLPPFDFIFIDADKQNTEPYFDWALKLARVGSLIFVDNVVRDGAILDPHHPDERVQGIRRFHQRIATEPRVEATALQTVGSKGYDGFVLARVVR